MEYGKSNEHEPKNRMGHLNRMGFEFDIHQDAGDPEDQEYKSECQADKVFTFHMFASIFQKKYNYGYHAAECRKYFRVRLLIKLYLVSS